MCGLLRLYGVYYESFVCVIIGIYYWKLALFIIIIVSTFSSDIRINKITLLNIRKGKIINVFFY